MKLIVEHGRYGYTLDNLLYDDINFAVMKARYCRSWDPTESARPLCCAA